MCPSPLLLCCRNATKQRGLSSPVLAHTRTSVTSTPCGKLMCAGERHAGVHPGRLAAGPTLGDVCKVPARRAEWKHLPRTTPTVQPSHRVAAHAAAEETQRWCRQAADTGTAASQPAAAVHCAVRSWAVHPQCSAALTLIECRRRDTTQACLPSSHGAQRASLPMVTTYARTPWRGSQIKSRVACSVS